MIHSRRSLLLGIGALVAAPAIVRASSLMPVKAWCDPGYTVSYWVQRSGVWRHVAGYVGADERVIIGGGLGDGSVAQLTRWDVALSAGEIETLAAGASVFSIQPERITEHAALMQVRP